MQKCKVQDIRWKSWITTRSEGWTHLRWWVAWLMQDIWLIENYKIDCCSDSFNFSGWFCVLYTSVVSRWGRGSGWASSQLVTRHPFFFDDNFIEDGCCLNNALYACNNLPPTRSGLAIVWFCWFVTNSHIFWLLVHSWCNYVLPFFYSHVEMLKPICFLPTSRTPPIFQEYFVKDNKNMCTEFHKKNTKKRPCWWRVSVES